MLFIFFTFEHPQITNTNIDLAHPLDCNKHAINKFYPKRFVDFSGTLLYPLIIATKRSVDWSM